MSSLALTSGRYYICTSYYTSDIKDFFNKDIKNHIKLWDCPSNKNWLLYSAVNKDSKSFNLLLSFSYKSSWNFCKKHDCDLILLQWRMSFQASDNKGKNFLKLLDNESNPLKPSTIKDSPWLQYFGHSNTLYTRTTRVIVNHVPIGEYWLRFFPREEFECPCGLYPIESRQHILHKYKRFNNYWNPRRDSISHVILFLEFNSNTFTFD